MEIEVEWLVSALVGTRQRNRQPSFSTADSHAVAKRSECIRHQHHVLGREQFARIVRTDV